MKIGQFSRVLIILALMLFTIAQPAVAGDLNKKVSFNISPQPLDTALLEFSEQAGIQLMVAASTLAGIETRGISGQFTAKDALEALLDKTGLQFNTVGSTVTVLNGSAEPGKYQPASNQTLLAQNQAPAQENRTTRSSRSESAEQDRDDVLSLEGLSVTGSHIRGAGPVGSQVLTYNRDDIDLLGYSTLPQFIQSLPQNFNGGITESTSLYGGTANGALNNFNDGTGVNLRGLGNVSTLVLLNSQRMAPSGRGGDFVDISMIPLFAIDRVEVLPDGASAIYGSDAIAGVVNFKLRKDFDGAETRLRYGSATGGGLDEVILGQTFGKSWANGYGLISFEYSSRDRLDSADRDFSNTALVPNDLLPEQDRYSMFLTGGHGLTDNIELFTTAYYSNRESERLVYSPPFVPITVDGSDSKQFGASLGTNYDFGDSGWVAQAIGSYNANESIGSNLNVETGRQSLLSRKAENVALDLKFDGPVFAMPGGDAKLAVGGHYRRDELNNLPVTADNSSNILLLSEDFRRYVSAFFGELYLPLVGENNRRPGLEQLELSISGRYEHYSDFGSSTDPKVGIAWSPARGVKIRATYGTSFRAPLFTELDESGNVAFIFGGIPDPRSSTGSSNVLLLAGAGNNGIVPETATLWTTGLDYQPAGVPGLDINLTYFDIDYVDKIATPSYSLAGMLTDPRFASLVNLNGADAATLALIENYLQLNFSFPPVSFAEVDAVFDGRVTNLTSNEITGLDFSVAYGMESENSGHWSYSLNGTYLFDYQLQNGSSSPAFEAVSTIANPVDLRVNGGITWAYKEYVSNLTINYVSDYFNNVTAQAPVSSWTTANLTVSYTTDDHASAFLDDTIFTLSVINLLDEEPPFVQSLRTNSGVNYDPGAANAMGRLLSLQATKRW